MRRGWKIGRDRSRVGDTSQRARRVPKPAALPPIRVAVGYTEECTPRGSSVIATTKGILASHPGLARHAEERAQSVQNRVADAITSFAGSMWFVYLHIALFGYWLITKGSLLNDPFPFGLPR